jgi:hypothetical protein
VLAFHSIILSNGVVFSSDNQEITPSHSSVQKHLYCFDAPTKKKKIAGKRETEKTQVRWTFEFVSSLLHFVQLFGLKNKVVCLFVFGSSVVASLSFFALHLVLWSSFSLSFFSCIDCEKNDHSFLKKKNTPITNLL